MGDDDLTWRQQVLVVLGLLFPVVLSTVQVGVDTPGTWISLFGVCGLWAWGAGFVWWVERERRENDTAARAGDLDLDSDGTLVHVERGRQRLGTRPMETAEALHGAPILGPVRIARDRATLVAVPRRTHPLAVVAAMVLFSASVALTWTTTGQLAMLWAACAGAVVMNAWGALHPAPVVVVTRGSARFNGRVLSSRIRVVRSGVVLGTGLRSHTFRTDHPDTFVELHEQALQDTHRPSPDKVSATHRATRSGTYARILQSTFPEPKRTLALIFGSALPWMVGFFTFILVDSTRSAPIEAFLFAVMTGGAAAALLPRWIGRLAAVSASTEGVHIHGASVPRECVKAIGLELEPLTLTVDTTEGLLRTHLDCGVGWHAWNVRALQARQDGERLPSVCRVDADQGAVVVWTRPEWETWLVHLIPLAALMLLAAWGAGIYGFIEGLKYATHTITEAKEAWQPFMDAWGPLLSKAMVWMFSAYFLLLPVGGLALLVALGLANNIRARRLTGSEHLLVRGRLATLVLGSRESSFAVEDVVATEAGWFRLTVQLADGRRLRIPCSRPLELASMLRSLGGSDAATEVPEEAHRLRRLRKPMLAAKE